jgi:hypothetical protein
MDPANPTMSGAAEPLDQLIERMRTQLGFDAAVVAWDLTPAWNPAARGCRWQETLDFYRFLAASDDLPNAWTDHARRRFDELSVRPVPGARGALPRVDEGACLALCMEPMFEDILAQSESGLRRALGVSGRPPAGWPRWRTSQSPDRDLIAPAISCLARRSPIRRRVRGDFRTKKDEWGEYLLRQLIDEPECRTALAEHPVPTRLRDLMAAS